MLQCNGERNPSYSLTTTTDTQADIIAHIQVHKEYNNGAALLPANGGNEQKSGKRHTLVLADPAFSSLDNLEKFEAERIAELLPGRRMEVEERDELSRGAYDRSKGLSGGTDPEAERIFRCKYLLRWDEDLYCRCGDQNNQDIFTEKETARNASVVSAKEAPSDLLVLKLNACGLQCPGPIVKLKTEMEKLKPGEQAASDRHRQRLEDYRLSNVHGCHRSQSGRADR